MRSRSGSRSIAITRPAPIIQALWIANWPTGPQPQTGRGDTRGAEGRAEIPERPRLLHPRQGKHELGAAHTDGRAAEPFESAHAVALRDVEQAFELRTLLVRREPCEGVVEPVGGTAPHAGDETCQGGHAGQEHLSLDEPGRREAEEHRRALGRQPRPGVEPAGEPERLRRVGERPVPEAVLDLGRVLPPGLVAAEVASEGGLRV
nr:hypothetical protein [Rubricoccus marinus]